MASCRPLGLGRGLSLGTHPMQALTHLSAVIFSLSSPVLGEPCVSPTQCLSVSSRPSLSALPPHPSSPWQKLERKCRDECEAHPSSSLVSRIWAPLALSARIFLWHFQRHNHWGELHIPYAKVAHWTKKGALMSLLQGKLVLIFWLSASGICWVCYGQYEILKELCTEINPQETFVLLFLEACLPQKRLAVKWGEVAVSAHKKLRNRLFYVQSQWILFLLIPEK